MDGHVHRVLPQCGQNNVKNLTIVAWNVRTMLDRTNLTDRPARRSALVAQELKRYNVDIAALSETRLAGEGTITEDEGGYTFF